MSEYAVICVDIPKYAWMAFILHLTIVIPCLKELYTVFLKRQNLIFSRVAGNTWFVFRFRLSIFTSTISNLLLHLGTEGRWPWILYPQCICQWCFLMIYLSIVVVMLLSLFLMLFFTFWRFKGLNQWSTSLSFCKIVRLKDGAQDK